MVSKHSFQNIPNFVYGETSCVDSKAIEGFEWEMFPSFNGQKIIVPMITM
jgi:hypothetical protein